MSDDYEDGHDYYDINGNFDVDDSLFEIDGEESELNPDAGPKVKDFEDIDDDEEDLTVPVSTGTVSREIYGSDRTSNNVMTKYEYARLIGSLASMITMPGFIVDPVVPCDSDEPLDIAEAWLNCRKVRFPIEIKRPMPNGDIEIWDVSELLLPSEVEVYYGTVLGL